MRPLIIAFLLLGIALIVYGAWGIFTESGQQAYPEMAGIIPYYGGIAGITCLLIAGVTALIVRWRRGRVAG